MYMISCIQLRHLRKELGVYDYDRAPHITTNRLQGRIQDFGKGGGGGPGNCYVLKRGLSGHTCNGFSFFMKFVGSLKGGGGPLGFCLMKSRKECLKNTLKVSRFFK